MTHTEAYHLKSRNSDDETSTKILTDISNAKSPIPVLLTQLLQNKQFISQDTNILVFIMSSFFLPKQDYNQLIYEYICKQCKPTDLIYVLLMIAIEKAHELNGYDLLHNWPCTLQMVSKSFGSFKNNNQVNVYLDKLGSNLFIHSKTGKEKWFSLYLIFTARQQQLYQFLDVHAKNSWRHNMNINLLCTLDNLLHEQDPDLYEITMLKLAYYRADMVHEIDQKYAQIAVKL
jgi:hypothetical protein